MYTICIYGPLEMYHNSIISSRHVNTYRYFFKYSAWHVKQCEVLNCLCFLPASWRHRCFSSVCSCCFGRVWKPANSLKTIVPQEPPWRCPNPGEGLCTSVGTPLTNQRPGRPQKSHMETPSPWVYSGHWADLKNSPFIDLVSAAPTFCAKRIRCGSKITY